MFKQMNFQAMLTRAKEQFLKTWDTFTDEYKWKVISAVLLVVVLVLFLR